MEERTRLGRGLEEVSRFYLSGRPRDAAAKETASAACAAAPAGRRVVRVFHPGSAGMKSLFVANFALELARSRRPVAVWDGSACEGAGVRDMMEGVIRSDHVPDALTVRLYGLPDITVLEPADQPGESLRDLALQAGRPEGRDVLLISLPDTVESIVGASVPYDAIMLCPLDEASLLKVYAFVKVIRESDPASMVYVAFDGPPSEERALDVFSRFDAFARERLLGELRHLGTLAHDEALTRSREERMPLVLTHGVSVARDGMVAVSRAFLEASGLGAAGEAEP
jgi:hypothetical protein